MTTKSTSPDKQSEQTTEQEQPKTELQILKEQADALGIEYAANVTIKNLKAKITEHLKDDSVEDKNQQIKDAKLDSTKLVRVIITPVDSSKRDYQGQYFSVGNDVIGTISRFVPFNEEWLIEDILAKHIENKEFQYLQPKKVNGREIVDSKMVKAFNVIRMALPTQEEIDELKRVQASRVDPV